MADEGFWTVFATSRMPMLLLDDAAVYTAVNDAASRILGRSRQDMLGQRMGFATAPWLRPKLYDLWAQCERAGHVATPWPVILPDGRSVDVEAICTRDTPEPGSHLSLYWQRLLMPNGEALSPREQEVTRLLASGLTGEQIAQRLHLSPETVRTHIRNAMAHMHARTRAHLVALAVDRGLASDGGDSDRGR